MTDRSHLSPAQLLALVEELEFQIAERDRQLFEATRWMARELATGDAYDSGYQTVLERTQVGEQQKWDRYQGENPASLALKHAQVLRVQSGDVIVIRAQGHISQSQAENIRQSVLEFFRNMADVDVMVLGDGMDVSVMRQEKVLPAEIEKELYSQTEALRSKVEAQTEELRGIRLGEKKQAIERRLAAEGYEVVAWQECLGGVVPTVRRRDPQ